MSTDLADLAEQSGTKFILALFVDLRGKPCAKLVPVEAVDLLATEGVGFAGYAVGAMGQEPKDPDLMAIPDPASFTPIPFIKDGLAIVHCDPHVEGKPWPYAPRVILKALIQRAADAGFEPWVGAEVEYFLLTPQRRRHPRHRRRRRHRRAALLRRPRRHPDVRPPHRDLDGDEPARLVATTPTTTRTATASSSRTSSYADALTTADRVVTLRYLLSMIAAERGMVATFMPKPFADRTGSGLHLHLSLTSGGAPVFPGATTSDDRGLGPVARPPTRSSAGILEHACALQAVIAPTVNSYKRTGATTTASGAIVGAAARRPTAATTAPTTSGCPTISASNCAAATGRPTRTWRSPRRSARASTASSAALDPGAVGQPAADAARLPPTLLHAVDALPPTRSSPACSTPRATGSPSYFAEPQARRVLRLAQLGLRHGRSTST